MNFIFQSYPSHPWLDGWTFEPRECGASFREKNAGYFFQALETVGRIAPNRESPEWSIQIPIPQNSRINLLFNGFCGHLNQKKKTYSSEILIPEPGVLWGRFAHIPAPVLLTHEPLIETEGIQWLESDTAPALLAVRDGRFCLVSKARLFEDAVAIAENYLEKNIEEALIDELGRRSGTVQFFEQMTHHDELAVISTECMMSALRPPEGKIQKVWSQSPSSDKPQFNINELYPLALAWRHVDIDTAEALVCSALKLQGSSGAIPVLNSPHETFSVLEAPKPLLAKTAEKVWETRKNSKFIDEILQPLRRHVQWLLHHFDPKRRGLHCWQNSDEPLSSETYKSDLATADLTTLLLTEIEAINRLKQVVNTQADSPPWFSQEQEALESNLMTQFWNEEASQFNQALIRGKIQQTDGFSAFMPLLWNSLPARQRTAVLDRIKESGILPGGASLLSWRKSALDQQTFPLLQQVLVLETLKATDPNGTLIRDFSRTTLQSFVEWHTLSLKEHGTLHINAITAAYITNLQETHSYRDHGKGGLSGWLFALCRKVRTDRFELSVVSITLFVIVSMHLFYKHAHRPPDRTVLESQLNTAYAAQDIKKTLHAGALLIQHYPAHAAQAKLMSGTILLIHRQFQEASVLFAEVRQEYPDCPAAMISLGLAHQLQGNFTHADENYAEFTYLFDQIFPELAEEIQQFRYLMQEGFRAPPKWEKIYSYQIMHEL